MVPDEVAALLSWLHPDMMVDAMLAEVDGLSIEGGISTEDRARRTTELRDRLRACERAGGGADRAGRAGGQDIGVGPTRRRWRCSVSRSSTREPLRTDAKTGYAKVGAPSTRHR